MSSKNIHILLVEDDQSLQEGIQDLLEIADLGYDIRVSTASDGHEALQFMDGQEPDLIISDIMMPHMDGFEFLSAVRAQEKWIHIPFIFLTAKGKKQDVLEGRLSGAELYITKPFDSNELLDLVQTQLERNQNRRQIQQKSMKTFKRDILQLLNHEFRTPLTYVTAYYEMLADSVSVYNDIENMDEYLYGIQNGCERLSNLVEDLILVTDIRTGKIQEVYQQTAEPISTMVDLINQAIDKYRPLAAQHNIELISELPTELPTVIGVDQYLRNIISQLIENAIKFTVYEVQAGKIGRVTVRAAVENQNGEKMVVLTISDTGIGIAPSTQHRLFDLFFQHNRQYYEQQGSGTGLTIVKGLVDAHHGRIEIEDNQAVGATFKIILPCDKKAQADGEIIPPRPILQILLVEDDAYLLEGLSELLHMHWREKEVCIRTATDGEEGLAAVHEQKPHLIISDIMMPNMNGYELLEAVRDNPKWVDIPFIFLTAKGERKEIHHGLQMGAEEYITKPYDTDELLLLIDTQLNRYFQLKKAASHDFDSFKEDILSLLQPEFRDPLSIVSSYSKILAQGSAAVATPQDLRDSLKGIQQGSQRISELVEDFIILAELKTGEAVNAFESRALVETDLVNLLRTSRREYLNRQDEQSIAIHLSLDETPKPLKIDYDAIRKCFLRLMRVMWTACEEGGGHNVFIQTKQTAEQLYLHTWHDGRPFPEETAAYIHTITAGNGENLLDLLTYGPQLAIVRGIINVHGGTMVLKEKADGKPMFTLTLPVHEVDETMKLEQVT